MISPSLSIKKSGKSFDSTDPRDFIFDNRFQSAIIYKEEIRTVTIPANSSVKDTVYYKDIDGVNAYTFEFHPVVLLYVEMFPNSGQFYFAPFTFTANSDPGDIIIVQGNETDTGVDKDKLFVTLKNKTNKTVTAKYSYTIIANIG